METMTIIALLTVFAIATTPITSVFVTRMIDHRRERRGRRMEIFRTLMRTRRAPMSADHVGALNLIEIEFADEPQILSAWKELFKHFATQHTRRPDEQFLTTGSVEENRRRDGRFDKRLFDERQRLLAKVLHAMAGKLDFKIEQLEIFEGGYIPQGWEDEHVEFRLVRQFLIDLYLGRVALPVMAFDAPRASDDSATFTSDAVRVGDRQPQ